MSRKTKLRLSETYYEFGSSKITFEEWLLTKRYEDNNIGDLARDYIRCIKNYEGQEHLTVQEILLIHNACFGALNSFEEAVKSFKRFINALNRHTPNATSLLEPFVTLHPESERSRAPFKEAIYELYADTKRNPNCQKDYREKIKGRLDLFKKGELKADWYMQEYLDI